MYYIYIVCGLVRLLVSYVPLAPRRSALFGPAAATSYRFTISRDYRQCCGGSAPSQLNQSITVRTSEAYSRLLQLLLPAVRTSSRSDVGTRAYITRANISTLRIYMKVDALWCASIAALLAPFTSLLVAHRTKTGNPPTPLTEQLVAAIYRRAGGYGLAALPFLTITTGYVYVSSLDAFFKRARQQWSPTT